MNNASREPSGRSPAVDISFTEDVARFYESALVPLIFEPYAGDLARRVDERSPSSVLEVGCGTGVLTRAMAKMMPAECRITATDLNDAMLAYAQSVGTVREVAFRQADVASLPFENASFDVVACQLAAMFFPDRVTAYQEIRRVLRPGGSFLFSVWGPLADNEFAAVVTAALERLYPNDPPRFLERTPHGHGSPDEVEADLTAAGFSEIRIERRDDVSAAASPYVPAAAYCLGTPLRNEIEQRDPGGLARATAAATEEIRRLYGDGPVEARISALVVGAVRP